MNTYYYDVQTEITQFKYEIEAETTIEAIKIIIEELEKNHNDLIRSRNKRNNTHS